MILPPKVIHIKLGNTKMKVFHKTITDMWDDVLLMSQDFKLLRVYKGTLEGVG